MVEGSKRGWRALSDQERAVVDRLLSQDFPGRRELALQLEAAMVSRIDPEGSLQFRVTGPEADVALRVPVEGRYADSSSGTFGPAVEILLHVVDGRLHELEVYKTDGSDITIGPFEIDPVRIEIHTARTSAADPDDPRNF
jgi:hypothetical protein